jgi:hypothetical protein
MATKALTFGGIGITDVSHRNGIPKKGFQAVKAVKSKKMDLTEPHQRAIELYLRTVIRTEEGKRQYEKYSAEHNIDPLCIKIGDLQLHQPDEKPPANQDQEIIDMVNALDPTSDFWNMMEIIDVDIHSDRPLQITRKLMEMAIGTTENSKKASKFIEKLSRMINELIDRFEIFGYEQYTRAHAFMIICKGEPTFNNMIQDEIFLEDLAGQFNDVAVYVRAYPDAI